jgi:hypothetical protein
LYVDDSGSVNNPNDRVFVLAGVALFERGLFHLIKDADDCVAAFDLGPAEDIEPHGSPMYSGSSGVWKKLDRAKREACIRDAISTLARQRASVRLFAVAVEKEDTKPRDPVENAFEEICNRFDFFAEAP